MIIGFTGGLGSGKTWLAREVAKLGGFTHIDGDYALARAFRSVRTFNPSMADAAFSYSGIMGGILATISYPARSLIEQQIAEGESPYLISLTPIIGQDFWWQFCQSNIVFVDTSEEEAEQRLRLGKNHYEGVRLEKRMNSQFGVVAARRWYREHNSIFKRMLFIFNTNEAINTIATTLNTIKRWTTK